MSEVVKVFLETKTFASLQKQKQKNKTFQNPSKAASPSKREEY